VDLVLDGGPCRVGVESTVLSLTGEIPVLLRPGGVSLEELQVLIGEVAHSPGGGLPQAPGQLPSHYAPSTPLRFSDQLPASPLPGRWGLVSFQPSPGTNSFETVEVLSPKGDLREAAANLFSSLRKLDAMHLDGILALSVPDTGLGRAINDRLKRAGGSQGH
jgi:L-threonylcarbamoyladenylate synthase